MQNRFSVKTFILVILVYTFGISFINYTYALICYVCEDDTCELGPVYIKTCEEETSVCVLFKDATGRALNKKPDYVYRRSCGVATYPNNRSEWNCTQYTQNFDKCICRDDLCNGDESLIDLLTTTRYPPHTTESGESEEKDRSNLKMIFPRKFGRGMGSAESEEKPQKTQTIRKKCNNSQLGKSQGGIPLEGGSYGGRQQSGRSYGGRQQNGRSQSRSYQRGRSRNNKAVIKQNRYDYSGSYEYQDKNYRNYDY